MSELIPVHVGLLGHIDHGKTELARVLSEKVSTAGLDKHPQSKERGITIDLGFTMFKLNEYLVTLVDAPGHADLIRSVVAGANIIDAAVLVVAADEGAKPQTVEAIDHARAAGVPIVVAINKIDLPNANITRVKRQFQSYDLTSEDMKGKTLTVGVSARTKEGIDELLEALLLEAEMLELKANPHRLARGIVIEGKLSAGRGPVATVLVKNGTLHVGDVVISGVYSGKIKSMRDDSGQAVKDAPPSMPVEISGLSGVPEAGDEFIVVKDEKLAKEIAQKRRMNVREKKLGGVARVTLEDIYNQIKEGQLKELKIIIKADVQGSVEVLQDSLEKLSTEEVKLKVIHGGVGKVNESDIMLAAASQAIIIGFHIKRDLALDELIEKEKVDVRFYNVIYE
ncbi:MAG: translation initiation factor IF-2, partial [Desulfobacteraceae bacterium]|nr:translation initiation factor IF-2 [Desulfobacteraceae bacterium]